MTQIEERVAVIGLGYVGLPVAVGFARVAPTVGFDIDTSRIEELNAHHDRTGELTAEALAASELTVTTDAAALEGATFFVVTVPTPIDDERRPDLRAVRAATRTVARALTPGAVVVYESTVWPGLTEEICGPLLEEVSGLVRGTDFFIGYSPERINPGDKKHTLERIVKVVSGEDAATLDRVAAAYGAFIHAGVHRASSIAVAEAAKVIENTQRDLNIALMNELALIFDRLGISTRDVLAAAGTKWNFLPFVPGLVGGHCIGVDPYYLTARAESVGYHPEVILAGRRINDAMGAHVAHRVIRWLSRAGLAPARARVGIIGLTFKENVPDLRNSRVPDIVAELTSFGVAAMVADPWVSAEDAAEECGIDTVPLEALTDLDALILAVAHKSVLAPGQDALMARLRPAGLLVDVKAVLDRDALPEGLGYTAL
ncbi:MAG: UDP-N-acetyl-D-galactosamine dehydrogenase [Myxococcota bacterium]|jgi:UDP-N-acetyl-D-galactosamine dehydrogenase